jgi:hypothetical protein
MKPKPINKVVFPATIPMIETAVKVHGEGGMRLSLDVSMSNEGAFLPALALRGRQLIVTLRIKK